MQKILQSKQVLQNWIQNSRAINARNNASAQTYTVRRMKLLKTYDINLLNDDNVIEYINGTQPITFHGRSAKLTLDFNTPPTSVLDHNNMSPNDKKFGIYHT